MNTFVSETEEQFFLKCHQLGFTPQQDGDGNWLIASQESHDSWLLTLQGDRWLLQVRGVPQITFMQEEALCFLAKRAQPKRTFTTMPWPKFQLA